MTLTNWAGNITFGARNVYRPTSVDELRAVVAGSPRVRALGTGHSFNHLADTRADLVSVGGLPATMDIDGDQHRVTVAAGVRYGDLARHLHANGYALANLGSLPHISVAGACATGTHGSGDGNGNLATSVAAIDMVTATGDVTTVRRGDDDFDGVVVALGALGVVTHLDLDIVPTFDVTQHVYENLPRDQLDADLFAGDYSVSAFTDWSGGPVNQVWRKRLDATPPAPTLRGATLADGPRHPVAGMPPENCTEVGTPGPWHLRLPHFKLEFTPSNGDELQTEYLIARSDLVAALAALDDIRDRIAPLLLVSEIRTVAADDLWLSPSYRRDSAAIHFTWRPDPAGVTAVLPAVEERLAPFDARPHWGKVFLAGPAASYPRMADFVGLMDRYDPTGTFGNDFLRRYVRGED